MCSVSLKSGIANHWPGMHNAVVFAELCERVFSFDNIVHKTVQMKSLLFIEYCSNIESMSHIKINIVFVLLRLFDK